MSSPAERTRCPLCVQPTGEPCATPSGKQTNTHQRRWDSYRARWRSEEMVVEMIDDDPRFKLIKGDRLLAVAYPLDAKVTVIRRLRDGFDPECNQYANAVKFVGFTTGMMSL